MDAPAGQSLNAAHVLRRDQGGKYVADPAHEVAADFAVIVVFDQTFQTSVPDTPYIYVYECTVLQYYLSIEFYIAST